LFWTAVWTKQLQLLAVCAHVYVGDVEQNMFTVCFARISTFYIFPSEHMAHKPLVLKVILFSNELYAPHLELHSRLNKKKRGFVL